MSSGPTHFDPRGYATQLAVRPGSRSARPKSDYGLAVKSKQRRNVHQTLSHSGSSLPVASSSFPLSTPRMQGATQRQQNTGTQQWCSAHDSQELSRQTISATAAAAGRRLVRDSPVQARPPTAPRSPRNPSATAAAAALACQRDGGVARAVPVEEVHDAELSDAVLDASASTLLTQLQEVVVQISRQVVEERRYAGQLRDQIASLEAVIAEQDAMLDQLSRENETALQEKAQLMKSYQQELRRSVWIKREGSFSPYFTTAARSRFAAMKRTPISTAEVDRCVLAEFDRLSSSFGASAGRGSSAAAAARYVNPVNEVSPEVAAVLRSLAAQVLQLKQFQPQDDELQTNEREEPNQVSQHESHDGSTSSITNTAPPALLNDALKPQQPNAMPSPSFCPPASVNLVSHLSTQLSHVDAARVTQHTNVDVSRREPSQGRATSESSVSVDSAIYEDAATILSDIRARYGL